MIHYKIEVHQDENVAEIEIDENGVVLFVSPDIESSMDYVNEKNRIIQDAMAWIKKNDIKRLELSRVED
jgi:hypothetical protein